MNAIAIAEAESALFLNAIHYGGNGSIDRGLWQINSVHGYDPKLLLSSAAYNVRAAYRIARAATDVDWTPWWAFQTGSFVQFLPVARIAARGIDLTVIRGIGNRVLAGAALVVRSTPAGPIAGQAP